MARMMRAVTVIFGTAERIRSMRDQILAAKGQQPMASGFDQDARFQQGGNFFAQRLCTAQIGDGDLGAATAQEERRGEAGFAQADDQYFFAL